MDILGIEDADVPCRYELGFQRDPLAIVVRIRQECIPWLTPIPQDAPIIQQYLAEDAGSTYSSTFDKHFGFGGALVYRKRNQEWGHVTARIPCICTGYTQCTSCDGSGKDTSGIWDDWCRGCGGRGQLPNYDDTPLWRISRSLELLFLQLGMFKQVATARGMQLMTVALALNNYLHFPAAFIEGSLSKKLAMWLVQLGNYAQFPAIIEVMRATYQHMYGEREKNRVHEFDAWSHCGNIALHCPGNACGIHPDPHALEHVTSGYAFGCHNVDSLTQQLTLLAGLAALHDLARSEMQKPPT